MAKGYIARLIRRKGPNGDRTRRAGDENMWEHECIPQQKGSLFVESYKYATKVYLTIFSLNLESTFYNNASLASANWVTHNAAEHKH